ncbi:hypothetical protein GCM10010919_19970 [Alishewanella longhuensis]|uniref:Uncharacterized protein n=1 Tax=Alishewanella longhuensis TaxID=1091037 RepID=A0ABQ3KYC1_9ALTE|nr:hypothetical protein GCM10010919_19970 [Alishewanella longhuensis]
MLISGQAFIFLWADLIVPVCVKNGKKDVWASNNSGIRPRISLKLTAIFGAWYFAKAVVKTNECLLHLGLIA